MKLICELDGYEYYLGEEAPHEMCWYEAMTYCRSLGDGWELPSKTILAMCWENKEIRGKFREGWYWASCEVDASDAFLQLFSSSSHLGRQHYNFKTLSYSVRPVKKVKSRSEQNSSLIGVENVVSIVNHLSEKYGDDLRFEIFGDGSGQIGIGASPSYLTFWDNTESMVDKLYELTLDKDDRSVKLEFLKSL